MGLTFLNPGPALTAAAVAVPLLLALYFLKLRRRPVRVSTVKFWPKAKDDSQANVPLRMIRPSWLLFLHLLILSLVLLAFARPVQEGAGIGGRAGERVIIVIDRSASMNAVISEQARSAGEYAGLSALSTRLDVAKERGREIARNVVRDGGEVAVVAMGREATVMQTFTTSRSLAVAAIDAVLPTDEVGNTEATARTLRGLTVRNAGQSGAEAEKQPTPESPTRIVLLSDAANPTPAGESENLSVPVEWSAVLDRGAANTGIVALSAQRDTADPRLVRVFAELETNRPAGLNQALTLRLDGKLAAQRLVEAPANPAGVTRSAVTIEITAGAGLLTAEVTPGTDDALAADNRAALLLESPKPPVIAHVRGDRNEPGDAAASDLLGLVLEELSTARVRTLTERDARALEQPGGLQGLDLVVYDNALARRVIERPTITFGSPWSVSGSKVLAETRVPGALFWDRGHPLLRGVTLDGVVVASALPRDVSGAPAETLPLVRSPSGALVVLSSVNGNRHVEVGFSLSQTNWPLRASFPVFVANAVELLTARPEAVTGRAWRTGDVVRVIPNGNGLVALERVRSNDQNAESAAEPDALDRVEAEVAVSELAARDGSGGVPLGRVSRAGVYQASGPVTAPTVAVNLLDAAETGLAAPENPAFGGQSLGDRAGESRSRRELWLWLLAIAGVLLMVEWVVYGRSVRA